MKMFVLPTLFLRVKGGSSGLQPADFKAENTWALALGFLLTTTKAQG
jgi:hypothetical protein